MKLKPPCLHPTATICLQWWYPGFLHTLMELEKTLYLFILWRDCGRGLMKSDVRAWEECLSWYIYIPAKQILSLVNGTFIKAVFTLCCSWIGVAFPRNWSFVHLTHNIWNLSKRKRKVFPQWTVWIWLSMCQFMLRPLISKMISNFEI